MAAVDGLRKEVADLQADLASREVERNDLVRDMVGLQKSTALLQRSHKEAEATIRRYAAAYLPSACSFETQP